MTLGYTTVRSPIAGYISERNADIGTLVGPGGNRCWRRSSKATPVRIDFSMTALDYLRSKARNVNIGLPRHGLQVGPLRDRSRWPTARSIPTAEVVDFPPIRAGRPAVRHLLGTRRDGANPDHVLLPGQFTKVKPLLLDVRESRYSRRTVEGARDRIRAAPICSSSYVRQRRRESFVERALNGATTR